ncbi:hypothetical protein VT84_33200 [Gemmata sp. SH-PL17]|uniref:hypothetical protein n=1 Tax=Gemmata sp. SH-PL17 TaxID=1630693 RepID=UPI00078DE414|nr:hypothetical protein [Gemmata sp. SH-PL17]AMV29300.1 hypothetical protein VT84_33200 [Gemmata sp. SH-PL17]
MEEGLIRDEVVGPILWEGERQWWLLRVGKFNGRRVMGYIFPDHPSAPLSGAHLEMTRAHVTWMREHEPIMLKFVADQMFPWWLRTDWADKKHEDADRNPERFRQRDVITTADQFRERLHLECVHFKADRAEACYNAGDLIGFHTFWVIFTRPGVMPDQVMWG